MQQQIVRLAVQLEQAAIDERWSDIRQLDSRISELLTTIRQQNRQTHLQAELAQLKRSHQRVMRICAEQRDILQMKLEKHQQGREGLRAYTLFSSEHEDNS